MRTAHEAHLSFVQGQFTNAVDYISTVEDVDVQERLLSPLVYSVSELKTAAEDTFKRDRLPKEAFLAKCAYTENPLIDILQRLEIRTESIHDLDLLNINFNILGLTPNELKVKSFDLFDRISPEKVSRDNIKVFIDEVEKGYRINPYHNFTHGFSVCQVFYYMWSVSPRLQKFMDVDEMYIGCVASFAHDLAHRSLA